jgi:hypothetical protein
MTENTYIVICTATAATAFKVQLTSGVWQLVKAKLALDDCADLDMVASVVRKSMYAKDYHISAATIRSMRQKHVDVEYRRDEQDAASVRAAV